jgi:hypothetical protein
LLWRTAGQDLRLRIVVIAPLAYCRRPTPGRPQGKILYRQPAFLLCTNPALPVQQIVQQYFWRWNIEVNFREEKPLLDAGQAQVRHRHSCQDTQRLLHPLRAEV